MKSLNTWLVIIPWILLLVILFLWSIGLNPWKKDRSKTEIINQTVILEKIEQLGRLELVRYNYKEIFDYQAISSGQISGNAALGVYNFSPDLKVVLIARGEAVGCIDLQMILDEDIRLSEDTLFLRLPAPEICYYKLDMENTRIYDFERSSWWSRLFPDEQETSQVIEKAYRYAERQILQAAIQDGILNKTLNNAETILKPMLSELSGRTVVFTFTPENIPLEIPAR
jgi:hypothetical protein